MLSCSGSQEKIGIVDLPFLYASFDYQKELKIQFDNQVKSISQKEDSLEQYMNLYEKELITATEFNDNDKNVLFEREYKKYLSGKEYYAYQTDSLSKDFTQKIWKQLNSYVEEFGKENDYLMIVGTQGDGNVMYVKESANITNELIEYVNKKYNGQ